MVVELLEAWGRDRFQKWLDSEHLWAHYDWKYQELSDVDTVHNFVGNAPWSHLLKGDNLNFKLQTRKVQLMWMWRPASSLKFTEFYGDICRITVGRGPLHDRIVHENRESYIRITFSFRMNVFMICCNPFGVSTPSVVDKPTASRGAWLWTTSGRLAQLGGGHIPSTCTCSLGFSWFQGGFLGGFCSRKTHLFWKLMKWSKMWGRQVSIQKTNGHLDTLLIFLLTAWLALLSCRGSNINPTTFMADSFRRHGFLMCFQFISSCRTSSFLGQHPQVETWLALQRLARNQARMFAMVLLPYLNMTCSVMLFGHSWHASSSLKTNPRWLQVYNP